MENPYKYTPRDWCFQLADGRVWSTAQAAFVSGNDAQEWMLSRGMSSLPPSPVDTSGERSVAGLRRELVRQRLPLGVLTGPEERREEILARLAEIDAASVRPLRAIAKGEAEQADLGRLAALDGEAADLRQELAGLASVNSKLS